MMYQHTRTRYGETVLSTTVAVAVAMAAPATLDGWHLNFIVVAHTHTPKHSHTTQLKYTH